RDFLTALSGDGIIIIGGGSGTLSEACAAYMHRRPMVAIKNTGGVADRYADQYLDHRKQVKIIGASSPREAVKIILSEINSK
ncbi:MAG: TIGR00725 family protein, partial [Patescibacteria group bacterium]|nr:TIGR00725 family protein [Patescibacteria group bacterium]